jgi:hypothetical protein
MVPHDAELLQELLRRESRSLLHYVSESYPWSKADTAQACDAVRALAQAQTEVVARVARWLAKQHVPVDFPGAYPMHFTTANFIALHYLLPRLIADEERCLAAAERTHRALTENEVKMLVQVLIELKKKHLLELTALQTRTTPPALAS